MPTFVVIGHQSLSQQANGIARFCECIERACAQTSAVLHCLGAEPSLPITVDTANACLVVPNNILTVESARNENNIATPAIKPISVLVIDINTNRRTHQPPMQVEHLPGSVVRMKVGGAGDTISTSITAVVASALNDFYELAIQNTNSVADPTITDANLTGTGHPS